MGHRPGAQGRLGLVDGPIRERAAVATPRAAANAEGFSSISVHALQHNGDRWIGLGEVN
jgi:hypothetical protein